LKAWACTSSFASYSLPWKKMEVSEVTDYYYYYYYYYYKKVKLMHLSER
jgi:hypothetical protein